LQKERSDREAQEVAERRHFYGELAERKLRHADNKLLTHADALLAEARRHQRPPHALRAAVDVSTPAPHPRPIFPRKEFLFHFAV
jgi:hypothetical protein